MGIGTLPEALGVFSSSFRPQYLQDSTSLLLSLQRISPGSQVMVMVGSENNHYLSEWMGLVEAKTTELLSKLPKECMDSVELSNLRSQAVRRRQNKILRADQINEDNAAEAVGSGGGEDENGGGVGGGVDKDEAVELEIDELFATLLQQENDAYNHLLSVARTSLWELRSGLGGAFLLSQAHEDLAGSLLSDEIPKTWLEEGYMSDVSLTTWLYDLRARVEFIKTWALQGRPTAFWFSALHRPQAFLSCILQSYSLKHQIPLEKLKLKYETMKMGSYDVNVQPVEGGAYIYGLFLQGAVFDAGSKQRLIEPEAGVTFSALPMGWLRAEHIDQKKNARENLKNPAKIEMSLKILSKSGNQKPTEWYECPVFMTPSRRVKIREREKSTSLIMSVKLVTQDPVSKWVRAGVAAFCGLRKGEEYVYHKSWPEATEATDSLYAKYLNDKNPKEFKSN